MPNNKASLYQRLCIGSALVCVALSWVLSLNPDYGNRDFVFSSVLSTSVWCLSLLGAILFIAAQWRSLGNHALFNPLLAVAANLLLSSLIFNINIPLYLDMMGTAFIAIIYGPVLGMGTAVLTACLASINNPLIFVYLPTAVVVAYLFGWLARRGAFKRMLGMMFAGTGIGIVAGLSTAMSTLLLPREYGQRGPVELMALWELILHDERFAVLLQSLCSEVIDKTLTVLVVCVAIRLAPKPILRLYDYQETRPAVDRVLTEDRFSLSLDEEPPKDFLDRIQRYF
ncbi:hypothetical protein CYJ44_007555 [Corynebacterium hesseae]|uniref:ECF transporter S component n=1 Tax=Corynebacterium hesseae TaxID=2913502 RepID=A0ABU9UIG6_9CORY|nr:hypothetical protein CYJ44_08555 [Corynebacterium aurimucosum]